MNIATGNARLYKMSTSQRAMASLASFGVHVHDMRVPTYIVVKKNIDLKLMNRALNLEIARNDCLRLHFKNRFGQTLEYFAEPSSEIIEFPVIDFRGMTDAEMQAWLNAEAAKPLNYKKDDTFRLFQFITPEGKNGMYLIASHAIMDLYAVFNFYKDVMLVYDSLESGDELPAPLSKYEDVIRRQSEIGGGY